MTACQGIAVAFFLCGLQILFGLIFRISSEIALDMPSVTWHKRPVLTAECKYKGPSHIEPILRQFCS